VGPLAPRLETLLPVDIRSSLYYDSPLSLASVTYIFCFPSLASAS
jgi:hypothetical protein